MSTFIDGPFAGASVPHRRTPIILRVVRDRRGVTDVLDQLHDEPRPGETIHVYRLVNEPVQMHLCIRGKGKSAGGWYSDGRYVLHDEQPGDDVTRTNEAWAAWCEERKDAIVARYHAELAAASAEGGADGR